MKRNIAFKNATVAMLVASSAIISYADIDTSIDLDTQEVEKDLSNNLEEKQGSSNKTGSSYYFNPKSIAVNNKAEKVIVFEQEQMEAISQATKSYADDAGSDSGVGANGSIGVTNDDNDPNNSPTSWDRIDVSDIFGYGDSSSPSNNSSAGGTADNNVNYGENNTNSNISNENTTTNNNFSSENVVNGGNSSVNNNIGSNIASPIENPFGSFEDFFNYETGWDSWDNVGGNAEISGDYGTVDELVDGFSGQMMDAEAILKTKETVHFVIKNVNGFPVYKDTGIKVDENNQITFNEAKDIFKQIAITVKGQIVEDVGRTLILHDGKISILQESEKIDIEEFIKLFDENGSKVRVLDTRAGGKFNLADFLDAGRDVRVIINDTEVELSHNPIVDNSQVLLPIRDIAENLGAKVVYNKTTKTATVTKGSKSLVFKNGDPIVNVNGERYEISAVPKVVNDEKMFTVVSLLVKELGADISWNTKGGIIRING